MYRVKHSRFFIIVALLGLLVAMLACGIGTAKTAAKPTVVITFPPAGTTVGLGQDVVIQSVAADPQGINRVELWVDGQMVHTQAVVPAAPSYTASQPWKPTVLGSHIVEVRAFNVNNVTNDPVQVVVTVAETVAEATPIPGAADTPTPTNVPPGVDTPTPTTLPTDTPVPPTLPYDGQPTIVALIGLNVRSGPGTAYPVIGTLPAGQAARITGQNADGTWWQIVFPPDSGGRGWVSSGAQYGTAYNTESVSIVETPAPPTYTPTSTGTPTNTPQPTNTPTNTPPPTNTPTNVPPPQLPVIHFFQSDHNTITAGQSATLSWDLSGAQWAHLRYDGHEDGVTAPGNRTVSPDSTTTYTLIAHNAAGDTTADVTITVNPAAVTVHASGVLNIPQTYHADLDTGAVTSSGADFWFHAVSATQRYVEPENGAKLKKVSSATHDGCEAVSGSLSTAAININNLPSGSLVCVRTNAGRLAGFRVNSNVGPSPGTLHISFTTWD